MRCARATASRAQVQLGLTYVFGGVYDDPATAEDQARRSTPARPSASTSPCCSQNWLAVRVGVPVYVDPVAVGLQLGAPIKFLFGDKFALGGIDDLLNIKIVEVRAELHQRAENATNADFQTNNTETPNGHLRFAFYGIYQHKPNLAIIARRRHRQHPRLVDCRRRGYLVLGRHVDVPARRHAVHAASLPRSRRLARLRRSRARRLVHAGRLPRAADLSRISSVLHDVELAHADELAADGVRRARPRAGRILRAACSCGNVAANTTASPSSHCSTSGLSGATLAAAVASTRERRAP